MALTGTAQALGELFDILPDAVVLVDGAGRIVLANAAVRRILGYDAVDLVGRPVEQLIPEGFRSRHAGWLAQFREHGQPKAMGGRPLLQALHKSGEEVPVSISIGNLTLNGERMSVAVIRDALAVRDFLDKSTAQAQTDALTGLANRLYLSRRVQAALVVGQPFALLFLDFTDFKALNDRYGHATGDEVLRLAAKRIQALVRPIDVVVRLGGDEFVILLDGLSDARRLEGRALAVVDSLCQPFHIGNVSASIGVNVGGAMYPRDGTTEEGLISAADRNMYWAKHTRCSYWNDAGRAGTIGRRGEPA